MSDPEALAGTLTARPGRPLPTILSTRREWAAQLARGRPADELPALLASLYALCGGAHRVAARRAVQAAQGRESADVEADARALQADTLREHLRRMWLDWPRALPVEGAEPSMLAACAVLADAAALDASRGWIEQQVLGMAAADWVARWQRERERFVADWADAGATHPARWLREARAGCVGLQHPCSALTVHASRQEIERLAAALRDDEGFALRPLWRGHSAETGAWTRLADHGNDVFASAFMRLASRVADVAHLVAPGGERWLAQGALQVGATEGLAWCEMARGLLVHWVRLDTAAGGTARIARCHVLAPTEWNFHPYGTLARMLAELPRQVAASKVRLLAAAFDPCVTLAVEPAPAATVQDG
jgi:hypothetical protein